MRSDEFAGLAALLSAPAREHSTLGVEDGHAAVKLGDEEQAVGGLGYGARAQEALPHVQEVPVPEARGRTWASATVSANPRYGGDVERALGAIKARAIVMPSETDQYFPVADNEIEVGHMPDAEPRPTPSIWGHGAEGPGRNPEDTDFIDRALRELLAS